MIKSISPFEPIGFAWVVGLIALVTVGVLLVMPLIVVFSEAFKMGWSAYAAAIGNEESLEAIYLTLVVALIAVPINLIFGVAAAWLIARFQFRGKGVLIAILDLPLSISPVISGLIFVLLFGGRGWFAPWLEYLDIKIIYAFPGLVLATIFVTMPYIARNLIPLMQEQGADEELAALGLGASALRMWRVVTLPNVLWGLLYGVLLTNARAMGEFGAVSVVSGHIRGETTTIPLHIEILYNDFDYVGAFAMSSLLAMLALVTLAIKTFIQWKINRGGSSGDK